MSSGAASRGGQDGARASTQSASEGALPTLAPSALETIAPGPGVLPTLPSSALETIAPGPGVLPTLPSSALETIAPGPAVMDTLAAAAQPTMAGGSAPVSTVMLPPAAGPRPGQIQNLTLDPAAIEAAIRAALKNREAAQPAAPSPESPPLTLDPAAIEGAIRAAVQAQEAVAATKGGEPQLLTLDPSLLESSIRAAIQPREASPAVATPAAPRRSAEAIPVAEQPITPSASRPHKARDEQTPKAPPLPEGADDQSSLIGQRIGKYRLTRELGRGGMGAVYEAVHESIAQRVAVKVLYTRYARDSAYIERFFYEARAISFIPHPGLIKIFDHGQLEDGSHYILMEFLDGESLLKRLTRLRHSGSKLEVLQSLRIARQIASTLGAVHERGIVHRDLKPANVVLNPDPIALSGERVKILDFGIAKIASDSDVLSTDAPGPMTSVGTIMGTPTYMSPEQCQGLASVDSKSDVYSLGVMLYEMLGGRPPFVAQNTANLIAQHLMKTPPPLRELAAEVPPAVAELVHSLLAKEPASRPTMSQIGAKLEQLEAALQAPATAPAAAAPVIVHKASAAQRGLLVFAGLVIAALVYLLLTGRSRETPSHLPTPPPPSLGPAAATATPTAPAATPTTPTTTTTPAVAPVTPPTTPAPAAPSPTPTPHSAPVVAPPTAPAVAPAKLGARPTGPATATGTDPRKKPPVAPGRNVKKPVPARPPAQPGAAKPPGGKVEVEIVN